MEGNSILSSVIIRCFTLSQSSFIIKCSSVFALFLVLLNKAYYGTKYFSSFCVVRFYQNLRRLIAVGVFSVLCTWWLHLLRPTALPYSAVVFPSWHLFTLSACGFRAAGLAECCSDFAEASKLTGHFACVL